MENGSRDTDSSVLRLERRQPHVLELVLNRPEKLNAINAELAGCLSSAVNAASADGDTRVVVIRGEGRSFSVGADVTRSSVDGETYGDAPSAAIDYARLDDRARSLFLSIWNCPLPVIAQVHGYCLGMSTILMQCCDLVYCSEDAVFGWPTVPLGGGMIAPVWAHTIGVHRAKELSYLIGSQVSGLEAAQWGVANRALPADRLDETVDEIAARIARLSPDLLRIKKAAINHTQTRNGFEETLRLGPIWDAAAHESEIARDSIRAISEEGLRATIERWRP